MLALLPFTPRFGPSKFSLGTERATLKEDLYRVDINVFGTVKMGGSGWDNVPVEVVIITFTLQTDVSVRVIVSEERHACIEFIFLKR